MSEVQKVADEAKAGARAFVADVEAIAQRAEAAIQRWYDRHFHRAAVAGSPPITSTDKAELHAAVADAIKSKE